LAVSSVVQLTTQHGGTPYEVTLPRVPWLPEQSYCNAQTVQPVAWVEFRRKIGQFDARVLKNVRAALGAWLGI
jgi:mRNA-degrading endonuclease toxin of MazEF toxin-antitoxin module